MRGSLVRRFGTLLVCAGLGVFDASAEVLSRIQVDSICENRPIFALFPFQGWMKVTRQEDRDAIVERAKAKGGLPIKLVEYYLNNGSEYALVAVACSDTHGRQPFGAFCFQGDDASLENACMKDESEWHELDSIRFEPFASNSNSPTSKWSWNFFGSVRLEKSLESLGQLSALLEESEKRTAPYLFDVSLRGVLPALGRQMSQNKYALRLDNDSHAMTEYPERSDFLARWHRTASVKLSPNYKYAGWIRYQDSLITMGE